MKSIFKKCPKCGCKIINIEYKNGYVHGVRAIVDFLKLTCQRCNYTWNENCLDHNSESLKE